MKKIRFLLCETVNEANRLLISVAFFRDNADISTKIHSQTKVVELNRIGLLIFGLRNASKKRIFVFKNRMCKKLQLQQW